MPVQAPLQVVLLHRALHQAEVRRQAVVLPPAGALQEGADRAVAGKKKSPKQKKSNLIQDYSFLTNLLFIKKLAVGEGVEPSRGS